MSRNHDRFDEPDDEWNDSEYPDEDEDDFDDEESETLPCPQCGEEIHEDAVRCPYCGSYVTAGGGVWTGRPLWWIVLAVLGVVATIAALAAL
jgi:hypothetical protein